MKSIKFLNSSKYNLNRKTIFFIILTVIILFVYNVLIVEYLYSKLNMLPSSKIRSTSVYYDDFTFFIIFLFIGILGPINEELQFRYFLTKEANIFFPGLLFFVLSTGISINSTIRQ